MRTFAKGVALVAAAVILAGCASAPKGLTESQAVGVNHSPAALYSVSVSGNAKAYTSARARERAHSMLTAAGGFSFVDQERVNTIYNELKEEADKKARRAERGKKFDDALAVLSGKKSVVSALTDDDSVEEQLYLKDIYKAISKETKCKYFVRVSVTAGVRTTDTAVKPAAMTSVMIYYKDGSLKKEIHAISSVPSRFLADLQDKSEIANLFPDLIEKSMQLAAENMHKKDKLFEIQPLKDETMEIVTSEPYPISFATWE